MKRIGRKGSGRQGGIKERSGILKVRKHGQVLVAKIARERTIETLTIRVWNRRRESREIECLKVRIVKRIAMANARLRKIVRTGRGIWSRVRCWSAETRQQ